METTNTYIYDIVYLLDASVNINIHLLPMVEAYSVFWWQGFGSGLLRAWGRWQRYQRHPDLWGARPTVVTYSVRPRVLWESHQSIRPFPRCKLSLHLVFPSGVGLHSHVNILSCYYSWRPPPEKPRLDVTDHLNFHSGLSLFYVILIFIIHAHVNLIYPLVVW